MASGVEECALGHPIIETLSVKNYRVLQDVTLRNLTPLTVLFGPNGSGKSTLFDVFSFLNEAFTSGLRPAWDARGRMAELRSRGMDGPVCIELTYRESRDSKLMSYRLEIEEKSGRATISKELLRWTTAPSSGAPQDIVRFAAGRGTVYSEVTSAEESVTLEAPDLLAVAALGQLTRYPHVAALRRFVADWYLSYVNASNTRSVSEPGPAERLSRSGDNLPNVIEYYQKQQPKALAKIFEELARGVPQLVRLTSKPLPDGRLLLRLKDRSFDDPVLANYTSDGTLKLLAYLTVLMDPNPPALTGIEEPENQLHPKLLLGLANRCRAAGRRSQVLVTTHSPYFANALEPKELWLIHRTDDGFAKVMRGSEIEAITTMVDHGGELGDLWMEGYFGAGDPVEDA